MKIPKCISKLFNVFQGSFINAHGEFIAHPKSNLYFRLADVETEEDVCYKLLAWCSRAACKGQPYYKEKQNELFRAQILKAINDYCSTNFTHQEVEDIYCKYGNGIAENECREFIRESIIKKRAHVDCEVVE